jgi:uncharacterized protein
MRCNLNCSYCYWFRDSDVYNRPKLLENDVEKELLLKLDMHILRYSIKTFTILFHGGEPTLIGKTRFKKLCTSLEKISVNRNCKIKFLLTTNAILLDQEWVSIFKKFDISPAISLDGPRDTHDKNRVDFKGNGSFDRVIKSIQMIRKENVKFGLLSVCNPDSDPVKLFNFFTKELKCQSFNVLIPDATHEDTPKSISKYFIQLFNCWFTDENQNIKIPFFETIIKGLLGYHTSYEGIGFSELLTSSMLTDGQLQPNDIIRIRGNGSNTTNLNIKTHTFQDLKNNSIWKEARDSSINLHDKCKKCIYKNACGGGALAHRWSDKNKFNNPSIYCDDLFEIISHIENRISEYGSYFVGRTEESLRSNPLKTEFSELSHLAPR